MGKTFGEMIEMYRDVVKRFKKIELNEWNAQGTIIELAKQVGELSKWVMYKEKYYAFEENEETVNMRLGNEMADVIAQVIRLADVYNIDLEKRRVFCQDEEIILTTKEYDLLVYFIVNKGLAISREQVLNKVWDENYFGSDRVVDDTLRRLRKKMPEINVRTIYGFGYRLD